MTEGLTPAFWLQVILTVGTVAAGFGVLNANVKNIAKSLDLERQSREEHAKQDDKSFHDLRDQMQGHHGRISRIEGQQDLAEKIAEAFRGAR